MSAASGAMWAFIGLLVAFVGNQPVITLQGAALLVAGGAIAAPVIGIIMGGVSRVFGGFPTSVRVLIAGGSLYAAVFLFVVASRLLSAVRLGSMPGDFWLNSVGVAWFSLVGTEFSIVLWPLACANHLLASRAWDRRAVDGMAD